MKTRTITLLLAPIFTLFSCSEEIGRPDPAEMTAKVHLAQLQGQTAKYKQHKLALRDGWDMDISGCVEHPAEGGMGHHFARMEYMDNEVNHLNPEVLLYIPNNEGEMELLGVEFIVPFDFIGPDEEPPILFNQDFHANHELEIWALHVWTEKENPNGIFYDWNPEVSCSE